MNQGANLTSARFTPSMWLRWSGAITVFAAGIAFLVEGYSDTDVMGRQLLWALMTLGLTAFGIVALRRFHDATGARVSLGLAAASIPAHFAQAGSALWSYRYEGIGSFSGVMIASAVAVLLSIPLALGVSALVRGRGALLTLLLFGLSCLLLLPTRSGDLIAAISVSAVALFVALDALVFRNDPRMNTAEGVAARALLLAPLVILLARNAFYQTTDLWVAAVFAAPSAVGLSLPFLVPSLSGRTAGVLQVISALGLTAACAIALPNSPIMVLAASAALFIASIAARHVAKGFATLGAIVFAAGAIFSWFDFDVAYAALVVPIGCAAAWVAYRERSLALMIVSGAATLLGLLGQSIHIVRFPVENVWLAPACVGLLLLVLASLVESRRKLIEVILSKFASHFSEDQGNGVPPQVLAEPDHDRRESPHVTKRAPISVQNESAEAALPVAR